MTSEEGIPTGFNEPPPEPHTHPPGLSHKVRNGQRWILAAFLILALGTGIALTRQQVNFNDHKRFDRDAEVNAATTCRIGLENRQIIEEILTAFRDNPSTPTDIMLIAQDEIEKVQRLEKQLKCKGTP